MAYSYFIMQIKEFYKLYKIILLLYNNKNEIVFLYTRFHDFVYEKIKINSTRSWKYKILAENFRIINQCTYFSNSIIKKSITHSNLQLINAWY